MKFLITGANGFVGKALSVELLRQGYAVAAAVRSAEGVVEGASVQLLGSIDKDTDWTEALLGVDVVIHLAARVHVMREDTADPLQEFRRINVAATEQLARSAVLSGVKRLVYVSSIKVNGEATIAEKHFTADDEPSPQDPYGVSKYEAEQVLHKIAKETGLEVVIVRPPLVYGAGVKGNFAQMMAVISKGIPLPFASVHNQRSLVYLGNLVDALIICGTHPKAGGQTYLISDGEDVSTSELLRRLGVEMGCPTHLFYCPTTLLKVAGYLSGKSNQIERLLGMLQVDSGKIRRELNWTPLYTLQQGLQATAAGYQNKIL